MVLSSKKGSTETLSALIGVLVFVMIAIPLGIIMYKLLVIPTGLQKTLDDLGNTVENLQSGESVTVAGNIGTPGDYLLIGFGADNDYFGPVRYKDTLMRIAGNIAAILQPKVGWSCISNQGSLAPLDKKSFVAPFKKPKRCGDKPCICFFGISNLPGVAKNSVTMYIEDTPKVCRKLDVNYDLKFGGRERECAYGPFIFDYENNVVQFQVERAGDEVGICKFPPCLSSQDYDSHYYFNRFYEKVLACKESSKDNCYCSNVNLFLKKNIIKIYNEADNAVLELGSGNKVLSRKVVKDINFDLAPGSNSKPKELVLVGAGPDVFEFVLKKVDGHLVIDHKSYNYSHLDGHRIRIENLPTDEKLCYAPKRSSKLVKPVLLDYIDPNGLIKNYPFPLLSHKFYANDEWVFLVLKNPFDPGVNPDLIYPLKDRIKFLNGLYDYKNKLDVDNDTFIGDDLIYVGLASEKVKGNKDQVVVYFNDQSEASKKLAKVMVDGFKNYLGKVVTGSGRVLNRSDDRSMVFNPQVFAVSSSEGMDPDNFWFFCQGDYATELKVCSNDDGKLMPSVVIYIKDAKNGVDLAHQFDGLIAKVVYGSVKEYYKPEEKVNLL